MSKQEGLTARKEDNFSEWYTQVIQKADLADYTAVSGCIVFKPAAWGMWEILREVIDKNIKKMNVKNVYFPLLIPESLLKKEQAFLKGFSPEVAWVTQAGNTKLDERLAVRPTSEAIMYDSLSKWIRSWRDLPLKLNQWSNVVRCEFRHPIPFFRTREFVFNEGHTAFATEKEADLEMKPIMSMYEKIMADYMALYGLIGKKTDKEKFAGAKYSISIEVILPNGRGAQGPAFHSDGQNFSKAYNIKFIDKNEKEQHVYQNTWAFSTRMLGIMYAIHSDNKGVIIPPKLAENKLVIIPILFKEHTEKIIKKAKQIEKKLSKFNPILDLKEEYSPGWKFNHYELRGIPIRIEIGPRDIHKKQVTIVRRDTSQKLSVKETQLTKKISVLLEGIHNNLYEKSRALMTEKIVKVSSLTELKKAIKEKKVALAPLCKSQNCEDNIKDQTAGAKTLNIPFDQPKSLGNCVYCNKKADYLARIGKSY